MLKWKFIPTRNTKDHGCDLTQWMKMNRINYAIVYVYVFKMVWLAIQESASTIMLLNTLTWVWQSKYKGSQINSKKSFPKNIFGSNQISPSNI